MRTLCVVAAVFMMGIQALGQTPTVVFDRPIDDACRLRITSIWTPKYRGSSTSLSVALVDRTDGNLSWEIATVSDDVGYGFEVERATARVVVLSRRDFYGRDSHSVKLFFDTRSKRLLNRFDFETPRDVTFANEEEARRILKVSAAGLTTLREGRVFAAKYDRVAVLPEPFSTFPLPQSTYREFVRARPNLARYGGSSEKDWGLGQEGVGGYQVEDGRLWFGKSFPDAEGETGVGAIGFVDASGKYTFLRIPLIVDWSVQGFLLEPLTLWAGLVHHGEIRAASGGLLQYDRKTGRTRVHTVPDAIHSIARVEGAMFLGTEHGLYVIRDGTITRFRTEPDVKGQFVAISKTM